MVGDHVAERILVDADNVGGIVGAIDQHRVADAGRDVVLAVGDGEERRLVVEIRVGRKHVGEAGRAHSVADPHGRIRGISERHIEAAPVGRDDQDVPGQQVGIIARVDDVGEIVLEGRADPVGDVGGGDVDQVRAVIMVGDHVAKNVSIEIVENPGEPVGGGHQPGRGIQRVAGQRIGEISRDIRHVRIGRH